MNKIIQLGRLTHARSPRESVSQKVIVQQTDSRLSGLKNLFYWGNFFLTGASFKPWLPALF